MRQKDNLLDIARDVLSAEAEAIIALIARLDSNFEKAVETIFSSSGRTVVTGMGKSGLIGKKIAATLSSTGTPTIFLHPAEAGHGDLGMVTAEDIVIAISNSGETDEILRLIPYIKRFNVTLISMTKPGSSLARTSDMLLDVSVKGEACPIEIVPTSSTTAALAMGDALAVALLTRKGFREEDFAIFHPNGSLGKKLLVRVEDLMHSGESIPIVNVNAPMTDTTLEMSSKMLGMTVVCDDNGLIAGIITDGDVRRGLHKWGAKLFEMRAGEVMLRKPKSISGDILAAKALSIMEEHSITSLIVPDENNRPAGVIHLHDILKNGIA
ncbi:arabinose 5-phosphate isomerase KdsD [bacterium BMS3Abin07]|nr:arabinose 5-phosphate isomerase KdsD [bacterium BMS3Abin07]GBE31359.1 arabinose 5-phosphate isomerase KdsD [bacterium BMS3Bbin05]HDL20717.1 KpsF/GutQ family sugar-phosphate isomerase [Nitrospirota bacterium]HDZ88412.1 KpsF/GutQ family sugar-phosphate isomerase [Nitrospirota bacterium]